MKTLAELDAARTACTAWTKPSPAPRIWINTWQEASAWEETLHRAVPTQEIDRLQGASTRGNHAPIELYPRSPTGRQLQQDLEVLEGTGRSPSAWSRPRAGQHPENPAGRPDSRADGRINTLLAAFTDRHYRSPGRRTTPGTSVRRSCPSSCSQRATPGESRCRPPSPK